MKIFETVEFIDGGYNDKGTEVGYELGESEALLKAKFEITHNFISFREISEEEYRRRKQNAHDKCKQFWI